MLGWDTHHKKLRCCIGCWSIIFNYILTPIRAWLINSIPKSLKLGIGAGIGLFLAIIGLQIMEVVVDNPVTLVQLGDLGDPLVLLRMCNFYSNNCVR